jgi:probable O-glycosylation ligase (exosortase A-associated)
MRDFLLFAVLAILVPIVPRRPFIGALAWVVFGVMYPHRLTWGPAYNFPFSGAIALLTLVGVVLTREHRRPKGGAAAVVLCLFLAWSAVTTFFAFYPAEALDYLDRVAKIFLMTFVLMLLISTREQVEALLWCLVVALGFYGTKGGLFTLFTGGNFMVMGPPDSPMEGNNSLGVGTVIIIPLMYYLFQAATSRLVRVGLMIAMPLCAVSVLGSYSRGALLAILAMGLLLWLRARRKLIVAAALVAFAAIAFPFMPETWTDRMNTIETYQDDLSAMQRIWAWETAYRIAKDRFPVGGGFEFQSAETAAKYSPNPEYFHVAHSIYFQVLGGLGFIGLAIFLAFWWLVWRQAEWLRTNSRSPADVQWAASFASMAQASLMGYFVGGAFLDIAFWDLPYYLYAAIIGARYAVTHTQGGLAGSPLEAPLDDIDGRVDVHRPTESLENPATSGTKAA